VSPKISAFSQDSEEMLGVIVGSEIDIALQIWLVDLFEDRP
jgi:hypothetical protein